jgi:class 3 adenylate cyclase
VFLGEIALLSTLLCGLHALRPRFGLAPVYTVFGLFEVFLFVAGKGGENRVVAPLLGDLVASVSAQMFLPLMMVTVVLIYTLEGTKEARRLIASVIGVYLFHGLVDEVLWLHGTNPPPGHVDLSGEALLDYDQWSRLSSLIAVLADFVTIVVVYQFLHNRLKWTTIFLPIWLAVVAAMVCDAVTYAAVNGTWVGRDGLRLLEKAQCGAAAALPAGLYIRWQLSRAGVTDLLDRDAIELLDLRRQVAEARQQLQAQQQAYRFIRETFSRYVSPQVVEQLVADPGKLELGGELREVTVLFADIRGYSTLSEKLSPTQVIGMLNAYFEEVGQCVLDAGGMINEIEGDGILAVFGAPLPADDHADRALAAAAAMLVAVERLNDTWRADGTIEHLRAAGMEQLSIRIGVHTGDVVVGNVGTRDRVKYAVIGDTVNTAARVEGLNKQLGTPMLCTASTAERLRNRVDLTDQGDHAVKGREERVRVYSLPEAS